MRIKKPYRPEAPNFQTPDLNYRVGIEPTLSANHADRATITLSAITRMLSALITVTTHIFKDSGYILFGLVAPTSGIFSTA